MKQVEEITLYEQCLYREDANSQEVESAEWIGLSSEQFEFVSVRLYEYNGTDIILNMGTRFDGEGEVWKKIIINERRSDAIRNAIHRIDVYSEKLYKHAEQAKAKAEA